MKKTLLTMALAAGAITLSQAQVLPFNKQENKTARTSKSTTVAESSETQQVNLQVKSLLVGVKKEIANGLVLPEIEMPEECVTVDSAENMDAVAESDMTGYTEEEMESTTGRSNNIDETSGVMEIFDTDNYSNDNADYSNANIYLVVGAFEVAENAAKLQRQMTEKGVQTQSFYNGNRGLYYIYVEQAQSMQEAEENITRIRRDIESNAWIYVKMNR